MSTTRKSIVFLALAFAITWATIAALICTMLFEKGRRVQALGLHFSFNVWWLLAWLFPVLIAAGSVALSILFSSSTYVDPAAAIIAQAETHAPEQADALREIPYFSAIIFAQALLLGPIINAFILTFTEELGWRGYLHDLWRRFGFWRASLGTGFVWGVWHAPMIFLYGHNYPDNRVLGVGLFVLFCLLLSPLLTLVRDRAGSVWAAGIFHGTFNALGGMTIVLLSNPQFPWNGAVGIGGYIMLAAGFAFVVLMNRRKAAPA